MSKKLFHWRNESGELDVFEAANYFAGANDHQVSNCHNNGPTFSHKLLREGCNNQAAWRSRRMSLDMPPLPIQLSSSNPFGKSSQIEKPAAAAAMKGKCKQPSSPGGKLASFLNSLFNQKISSKKKKKKSNSSTGAVNDEDAHSPSGWTRRRRRRSSLSELYGKSSSKTAAYNNAASSTSGFRTPPPYPNKSCKDNHKPENMFKFISSGISERRTSVHHWADEYPSEENEERKFDDDDYDRGTDSDSSSDLFDLPNRELLDYYSTGLPVYQTTQIQMNTINTSAPISATVI